MISNPSELAFASLLQYAPRGTTPISKTSRDVTYHIKTDSYMGATRVIAHAAVRLAENHQQHALFSDYFGPDVTVVPAPRSSPRRPGDLWPAERICDRLFAEGLCGHILPCLERTRAIPRAALAARGQRPNPPDHYDSVRVHPPAGHASPSSITLVDDILTRGSSFVGLVPRLQEAYPHTPIRCFALVRTISVGDIPHILAPVTGVITYRDGQLIRQP